MTCEEKKSAVTFRSSLAMTSSVIYNSTEAQKYLFVLYNKKRKKLAKTFCSSVSCHQVTSYVPVCDIIIDYVYDLGFDWWRPADNTWYL